MLPPLGVVLYALVPACTVTVPDLSSYARLVMIPVIFRHL